MPGVYKIAEAEAVLRWDLRPYNRGLADAKKALDKFTKYAGGVGGAFKFGQAKGNLRSLVTSIGSVKSALDSALGSARALNNALGRMRGVNANINVRGLGGGGGGRGPRITAAERAMFAQQKFWGRALKSEQRAAARDAIDQQRRMDRVSAQHARASRDYAKRQAKDAIDQQRAIDRAIQGQAREADRRTKREAAEAAKVAREAAQRQRQELAAQRTMQREAARASAAWSRRQSQMGVFGRAGGRLDWAVAGRQGMFSQVGRGMDWLMGRLRTGLVSFGRGLASHAMAWAGRLASGARKAFAGVLGIGGLGGAVGAGAALYGVGKESVDFESKLATLGRITDLDGGGIKRLGDSLQRLANHSVVGMHNLMEIADIGARMGVPANQLSAFTSQLARLSSVMDPNDLPIGELASSIGSLLTVFGKGYDDAERFGSMLVKLDQISVATGRDIIDIANRMSPAAALFKLKPHETLGLAAAMRQARIPVETAGTAFGQIMMRMASRRDSGAFAKIAGMNRKQFEGQLNADPFQALMAVTKGLGGRNAVEASRVLDSLHLDGQRVRATMIQLAGVMPVVNRFVGEAGKEWDSLAATQEGYNRMSKTTLAQLTLMGNNLRTAAIALGEGFLPVIRGFAQGITNLSTDLRAFARANAGGLQEWGMRVGQSLAGVGALITSFPDHLALAWINVKEKLEQGWHLFKQFGGQLLNFFADLGPQIGKYLAVGIENAFRSVAAGLAKDFKGIPGVHGALQRAGSMRKQYPKVTPKWDAFSVGAAIGGLPNRAAEKIAPRTRIAAAVANQDAGRARDAAAMGLGDILARHAPALGAALIGPAAVAGAGGRRRRPVRPADVGGLRALAANPMGAFAAQQNAARTAAALGGVPGLGTVLAGPKPFTAPARRPGVELLGRAIGAVGAATGVFAGMGGGPSSPGPGQGGGRGFARSRMFGAAGDRFNAMMSRGMTRSQFFGGMGGGWQRPAAPAKKDPAEQTAENTSKARTLLEEIRDALTGKKVAAGPGVGAANGGARPAVYA